MDQEVLQDIQGCQMHSLCAQILSKASFLERDYLQSHQRRKQLPQRAEDIKPVPIQVLTVSVNS